uniref:Uncharacterized protein n=1 Tax=Mucochytrium quahogii TaxID=96639 RepID=A0A7S2S7J6_9STRA
MKKKKDRKIDQHGERVESVSLLGVFRYADSLDWLLMLAGMLCGLGTGVVLPLFSIIFGSMYNDFQSGTSILEFGRQYAFKFGMFAVATLCTGFGQVCFFTLSSERQTLRIRKMYLQAVLSQDITWFDTCKSGELSSQIAENTIIIREALGDKFGLLFQFLAMFVAGLTIGFVENWKLTLVICSASPLIIIGGYFMSKTLQEATSTGLEAYARAGGVAEEAFAMIRTVVALGAESTVEEKYRKEILNAEGHGIRKARTTGIGMGFTFGVYFLIYALAFWYGSVLVKESRVQAASVYPPNTTINALCYRGNVIDSAQANLLLCPTNGYTSDFTFEIDADVCNCLKCDCGCTVADDCVNGGTIVSVFFAVVMGAFAIGQAGPNITALVNAKAAAAKIYKVIERKPEIDASSEEGLTLSEIKGDIALNGVSFAYPTRPEATVLKNINLEIKAGQTVALVGGSGCGKSTVTQLVQRFYDPKEGSVTLDGVNLKDIKLKWLREQIGLVSQEPVLFANTIAENIGYGRQGATRQDIEDAAKAANAYNFIMEFPEGFETNVGQQGASLSGGQKQRIAIARAIVRNPSILILDEATSALDNESERIVQQALDKLVASGSRTTIVIAHRLSTIRNSDKIVVLGNGEFMEEGTHDELMAITSGHYGALVAAATRSEKKSGEEEDLTSLIENDAGLSKRFGSSMSLPKPSSSQHIRGQSEGLKKKPEHGKKKKFLCLPCGNKKVEKAEEEEPYNVSIWRLATYAKPEKWLFIPAMICAGGNGIVMPMFSILFAGITNVYYYPTIELTQHYAVQYSYYFIALGICVAGFYVGQQWIFGIIGERITTRIRQELFHAMLSREIDFYDKSENSVGTLTSKLSTDAAMVKEILVNRLNVLTMNLVVVIAGLTIAFSYGWKMTLVLLACMPLMIIAGAVQMYLLKGFANEDDSAHADATQVLSESVMGIRTVSAFGLKDRILGLYDGFLKKPHMLARKKAIVGGLGYGFSQGVIYFIYSVAFLYGSTLINSGEYTFTQMMHVFFAVVMMGFGLGQASAMAPDVAKCQNSVASVFKIVDVVSSIDPFTSAGLSDDAETNSDITFQDVSFTYSSRPDAKIFNSFNLTVKEGTTVALVGQSGSGKSTAVSLLERFYDSNGGTVNYHGIDVKKANPKWLREQFGLVEQEPQLFQTTIFENIALGVADKSIPVTQEMVESAAKAANAHDFIMSFPEGYQTKVGGRESPTSGGQKQRICIARCLIRDPKVLLLDEATSALDNESERVVQDAIDAMVSSSSRTTIVIAHRLTTIKNADVICVVDKGKIIEQGTHAALLDIPNGAYRKLYLSQNASH